MRFDLYLESGPQHKRTWVFVPGLPGCSAVSATSGEAEAAAAEAIQARLEWLRRHGETTLPGTGDTGTAIATTEPLELRVAQHVIERKFLGFAQQFFAPDFEPMTLDEVPRLLRWAGWSREALVAAARAQTIPLLEKPASGGRSAAAILSHAASSEWAYVSATLGTLKGGSAAIGAIEAAGEEPWAALAAEREVVAARLANLEPDELGRVVEKQGVPHWSTRRMFRRILEHEWEHVRELEARV